MKIIVETSILKLEDRSLRETEHSSVIGYLLEYHPKGFDTSFFVTINGKQIDVDDYDTPLKDGDIVAILTHPGVAPSVFAALSGFWASVAAAVVNIAISMAVGQIFKPKQPGDQSTDSAQNASPSTIYSLNGNQNTARRGGIIPVIYGRVRLYPSLITEPYYRFEDNEEYLYQTMCVGHGLFDLQKVLINDSASTDFLAGTFKYKQLTNEDFGSIDGIRTTVEDPNYHELTKTFPDISNLEITGTVTSSNIPLSFNDDTITFHPIKGQTEPDLSMLEAGSTIRIANTRDNDGLYIIDFMRGNEAVVKDHIFVVEPSEIDAKTYEWTSLSYYEKINELFTSDGPDGMYFDSRQSIDLGEGTVFTIEGTTTSPPGTVFTVIAEDDDVTNIYPYLVYSIFSEGSTTFSPVAQTCETSFRSSFGPYQVKGLKSETIEMIEIDTQYLGGIYALYEGQSGFFAHSVQYNLVITYQDDVYGDGSITYPIIQSGRSNDPIRRSDRYSISPLWYNVRVEFMRITDEPASNQGYDKINLRSLKMLYTPKDNSDLGNITLLWAKVKATNAISSKGQFSINAWARRTDVANDIASVITDLYSSASYGARLNASDLVFEDPSTYPEVNGAIDAVASLFDVIQMIAKSVR